MKTSEAISLGIALLLTAYLVLSWRLRARRHPPENHWSGRGIDVTLIAGRVQSIRRTFGSALTPR